MQIGFDFGGSLIKLSLTHLDYENVDALIEPIRPRITHEFSYYHRKYINVLFTREEFKIFIDYLKFISPHLSQQFVVCTGGGVCDKRAQLQEVLGNIELEPLAEFKSIVEGVAHFAKIIPDFIYSIDQQLNKVVCDYNSLHPFLLANIGTGISINRVDKDGSSYLCGTSMGGTSLLGFSRLFSDEINFENLLNSFNENKLKNEENYLFESIYENIMENNPVPSPVPCIFYGIINNICKIIYMLAKNNKISNVMFIGNFMKGNLEAMKETNEILQKLSTTYQYNVKVC